MASEELGSVRAAVAVHAGNVRLGRAARGAAGGGAGSAGRVSPACGTGDDARDRPGGALGPDRDVSRNRGGRATRGLARPGLPLGIREGEVMKIRNKKVIDALGWLASGVVRGLLATVRYRYQPLGPAVAPSQRGLSERYIYAFWH